MPRAPRTARSPGRVVAALVAALAVHALAGAVMGLLLELETAGGPALRFAAPAPRGSEGGEARAADDRPIQIEALVDELAQPEAKTPEERKREQEQKREEENKDAKGQVVDIARPAIEARPDDARFLAEYDSRVAHETRGHLGHEQAGDRVTLQGGAESRLGEMQPQPATPSGLPGPRALRRAGGQHEDSRSRESHGMLGQDGAAQQLGPDGESRRPGAAGTPGPQPRAHNHQGGSGGNAPVNRLGMGEEGAGGKGGPRLAPTEEMLNRALTKGAGSPDWLHEVDDGESTALNAKKFKFAPFFNRVKRAVAEEWHPEVVYIRHDPSGNVYGSKDRITIVRVHLKPDGVLQAVTMLESSGVPFLDEEAVDAFRRAGPFVNPPTQLVEGDGLIHFNFGFIFDLSGHGNVKVFRYK